MHDTGELQILKEQKFNDMIKNGIEKLETKKEYGWDGWAGGVISATPPDNTELMNKINELIDMCNYLNNKLKEV